MSFRNEEAILRSTNKLIFRRHIFSMMPKCQHITGFCGAALGQYTNFCLSLGYDFKDIHVYENSPELIAKHKRGCLDVLQRLGINYQSTDILNAEFSEDGLYDLDFCSTMIGKEAFVKKLKGHFVFATSIRNRQKYSREDFFRMFLHWRGEHLDNRRIKTIGHTHSNKHRYFVDTYKSNGCRKSGTTMMIICNPDEHTPLFV